MKNRKRNRLFLFLILIVGVTIGFAALSTTLKINGISRVKKASWNIHWDNVANEDGVEATTPAHIKENTDSQVVEYEVFFEEPGDYYEFTVDAVNEGTLDGIIESITSTVNGEAITTLPNYINYSIKYADGTDVQVDDELKKNESKTYKIRVEYDKEKITPEVLNAMTSDQRYEFSFEVKYVQNLKAKAFANDSWDTIVTNIRSNPNYYPLGATKRVDMDINNDGTIDNYEHFHVRIINRTTPAECSTEGYSQTACGVVLDFEEVLVYHNMNPFDTSGHGVNEGNGVGNIGGWEHSEGRAFINSGYYERGDVDFSTTGIYDKIPSDLKAVIIDTFVVSNHNDTSTENYETVDKLYLPATKEVYGKKGTQVLIPGDSSEPYTRQFDYYEKKGLSTNPDTYGPDKKKYKGNYSVWGMRSVFINPIYPGDKFYWYGVYASSGGWGDQASLSMFMSPVFRIG